MDEQLLNIIINYIKMIYKPMDISVRVSELFEPPEYIINAYFEHIDDSYITNPEAHNISRNKAFNLTQEIRKDIESYFNTKTSGLDFKGFAPYVNHGLTIHASEIRKKP
jgi:hypothetical protein